MRNARFITLTCTVLHFIIACGSEDRSTTPGTGGQPGMTGGAAGLPVTTGGLTGSGGASTGGSSTTGGTVGTGGSTSTGGLSSGGGGTGSGGAGGSTGGASGGGGAGGAATGGAGGGSSGAGGASSDFDTCVQQTMQRGQSEACAACLCPADKCQTQLRACRDDVGSAPGSGCAKVAQCANTPGTCCNDSLTCASVCATPLTEACGTENFLEWLNCPAAQKASQLRDCRAQNCAEVCACTNP